MQKGIKMTNEDITKDLMNLKERQIKNDTKIDNVINIINELREDVKSTKNLTEDVHIMAINMANMQKTLEETNKKVDTLSQKDFNEYENNKKIVKDKVISAVAGAIGTTIVGLIVWAIQNFAK
jgi:predicted RNase H-like nuclease (RuvC/YqgF family)